jgi:transposase
MWAGPIAEKIAKELGFELRVVKPKPDQEGFEVLNKRWVFAWLRQFRRLNREYEHTIASAIATIQCASIAVMLNRL